MRIRSAVASLGVLAAVLGWPGHDIAQPIGSVKPGPRPWAVLSFRDRGVSGHWGDLKVVFNRTPRAASEPRAGGWVLDQIFTSAGVVEAHARADSRTCPGLDELMASLPSLILLGPFRSPAPPVPEEPAQTLQSVDDDETVGDDHFKVAFYNEGAMGVWVQRLFKLPPRCWVDIRTP